MINRKVFRLISVIALIAITVTVFVSCGNKNGYCTVVINAAEKETSYKVDLDKVEVTEGLISVLNYLKSDKNVDYASEDSGYGAFLTKVGDAKQDTEKGIYISIWTSEAADTDASEYATQKTYNGITLTSAAVGASKLTISDGTVIYIGTVEF